MKTLILMIATGIALYGCTSPEEANRALSGAGYKDINVTGYRFFGCDKNDGWHTGFEANGQSGQRVTGVVCSGIMKGATIRTD